MHFLSIIIVNYNTGELLKALLHSIDRSLFIDYEVVVVDNASEDNSFRDSMEEFGSDPKFRFFQMGYNAGFSAANNFGFSESDGELIHFLNPDTKLTEMINEEYFHAYRNRNALYINPLVNGDGTPENDRMPIPSLRDLFWWNICRKRARYWYKGASVIVSRENFELLGGWNEKYFLYAEDLDLFYTAWIKNIPIVSLNVAILHYGKASSKAVWTDLQRDVMVQKSNRLFFSIHFTPAEYNIVQSYFLLHLLIKHPSKIPNFIKAWKMSGNGCESPKK